MRAKFTKRTTAFLPLFPTAIFVDWNGVLCHDVFWATIARNPKHRYHQCLIELRNWLFLENRALVNEWQRGKIETNDLILHGLTALGKGAAEAEFLIGRLERDCLAMSIDTAVMAELAAAAECSYIVLATDNIEPFFLQLDKRNDVRAAFDAVLCSCTIGNLKAENTEAFFQPWLAEHQLEFRNAVLIDDSEGICVRFAAAGGTALLFKDVDSLRIQLRCIRSVSANTTAESSA